MRLGVVLLTIFLALHCRLSSSISFTLPTDVKKCLQEEVHKDVLVVGEFKLSDAPGQTTDLKVNLTSPKWSDKFLNSEEV